MNIALLFSIDIVDTSISYSSWNIFERLVYTASLYYYQHSGLGCVLMTDMQTPRPPAQKGSPQKSGHEWCGVFYIEREK